MLALLISIFRFLICCLCLQYLILFAVYFNYLLMFLMGVGRLDLHFIGGAG